MPTPYQRDNLGKILQDKSEENLSLVGPLLPRKIACHLCNIFPKLQEIFPCGGKKKAKKGILSRDTICSKRSINRGEIFC
jgi:hypothetical protein